MFSFLLPATETTQCKRPQRFDTLHVRFGISLALYPPQTPFLRYSTLPAEPPLADWCRLLALSPTFSSLPFALLPTIFEALGFFFLSAIVFNSGSNTHFLLLMLNATQPRAFFSFCLRLPRADFFRTALQVRSLFCSPFASSSLHSMFFFSSAVYPLKPKDRVTLSP